ncbi:MAG: hypothetical protein ACXU68_09155, partial [Croceibacterium sp.]
DHRTTRHCGYEISQQKRKRVEEPFGWGKTIGGLARPMLRGVKKLDFKFTLTMAAYDLIKLRRPAILRYASGGVIFPISQRLLVMCPEPKCR